MPILQLTHTIEASLKRAATTVSGRHLTWGILCFAIGSAAVAAGALLLSLKSMKGFPFDDRDEKLIEVDRQRNIQILQPLVDQILLYRAQHGKPPDKVESFGPIPQLFGARVELDSYEVRGSEFVIIFDGNEETDDIEYDSSLGRWK